MAKRKVKARKKLKARARMVVRTAVMDREKATYSPRAPGIISEDLLRAHRELERMLLVEPAAIALSAESGTERHGFENIVGVAIAEKTAGQKETGEQCVTVYVVAKTPRREIDPDALVPPAIDGIQTDVVEVGELVAQPYRGRYRPSRGGVSIGHHKVTAGSLGCLVSRRGVTHILSNNHVLANSNDAKVGDSILQPGSFDGGTIAKDRIAKLAMFVPIKFGGTLPNEVDAAIAEPLSSDLVSPENIWFGKLAVPTVEPSLNLLVKKAGRTTQRTRGRISGLNASLRIGYGTSGTALFRKQMVIVSLNATPFSQGGDSGSLIVTEDKRPVGLLFAGSASHTIANPIRSVLTALGAQIRT